MRLHPVITRKTYTKFKYIIDTKYVFYDAKLHKSNNSKHALSEIWKEGVRIKINETM